MSLHQTPVSYELSCEATVDGQRVQVRMMVDAHLYDTDADFRAHVDFSVRMQLAEQIFKANPPKISKAPGFNPRTVG